MAAAVRFHAQIQTVAIVSQKHLAAFADRKSFLVAALRNHIRCEKQGVVYFFSRSRHPRIVKPVRFESQGRTCRPGAAGVLATLTQAMIGLQLIAM